MKLTKDDFIVGDTFFEGGLRIISRYGGEMVLDQILKNQEVYDRLKKRIEEVKQNKWKDERGKMYLNELKKILDTPSQKE